MYIFHMRKIFEAKGFNVKDTVAEVRDTSRKVGTAAESQATLNIALTGVCVLALILALVAVGEMKRGAGGGR